MPKSNRKNITPSSISMENFELSQHDESILAKTFKNTEKIIRDFEDLKTQFEKLQSENGILKSENIALKQQLIDLDQYGRRLNLRFLGIQEEKDEACENKIHNFIKEKLKIQTDIFIDVAHRVGKKEDTRPRPIIVRFGFRRHASEVLRNRKNLKGMKGISIVEDLCPPVARLYTLARTSGRFDSVWTRNGRIFASSNGGSIIRIQSNDDINDRNSLIGSVTGGNVNSSGQTSITSNNRIRVDQRESTPRPLTRYQQPITKYTSVVTNSTSSTQHSEPEMTQTQMTP